MLDVFFISYGEINAEDNWKRLRQFRPDAKRVDGVKGIYEVHKTCAKLSATDNFWVVDADAWIVKDFDFSWQPDPNKKHWNIAEPDCVFIWHSHNPVNDLEYGYGGLKVFPRQPFLENRPWHLDLSTTIGSVVVVMPIIGCETRFNATPESAWIGGFRECAKLASLEIVMSRCQKKERELAQQLEEIEEHIESQLDWSMEQRGAYRKSSRTVAVAKSITEMTIYNYFPDIDQMTDRYNAWTRLGWSRFNGQYAVLGAQAGVRFGLANSGTSEMKKINDWDWLKKEFAKNVNVQN